MLKITIHDGPAALTFQVEGKLVGEWSKELERSWKAAEALRQRRTPIVDLTGTLYIDEEGKRVLRGLFQDGAFFRTAGALTDSIVSEITGRRPRPPAGRKILSGVFLFLIAFGIGKAADEPPAIKLTLRDAVQMALKQNPQVQIANLNIAESQENQTIARAGLLPQVNGGASESVHRQNIEALFGSKLPGFPEHIGPFWTFQAGLNGSVPLFDLTAWRRWQASKESTNSERAQQTTVREQDVQLVVSQYLGSLKAAADVRAAQSRADLAKALLDQAGDLQRNGAGTGIDTLRANVQYQNERQRLIDSQTELKTTLYGLARLLNIDPHQNIQLADEAEFFQTQKYEAAGTIEQAFAARPEMKTLDSQIRVAQLNKQESQAERVPKLSLSGQWIEQGLSPVTIIPVYSYEADVTVPLFTGGRIKAQTAVQEIQLKKLAEQQTDLRNLIALEVKNALAQVEAAQGEVDVANQGVDLAREEVTEARDRFQAGVANNIEVITAQDELSRANDNQIAALYRYSQARADLAHAMGQMESIYGK